MTNKPESQPERITGKRLCEERSQDPFGLAEMLRKGVRAWLPDTWQRVVDLATCPVRGEFPEEADYRKLLDSINTIEKDPHFDFWSEESKCEVERWVAEKKRLIDATKDRGLIAARKREAMLDSAKRRLGREVTDDFEARAFKRYLQQERKAVVPSGCWAFPFYPPEKEGALAEWKAEIVTFAFAMPDVLKFEQNDREEEVGFRNETNEEIARCEKLIATIDEMPDLEAAKCEAGRTILLNKINELKKQQEQEIIEQTGPARKMNLSAEYTSALERMKRSDDRMYKKVYAYFLASLLGGALINAELFAKFGRHQTTITKWIKEGMEYATSRDGLNLGKLPMPPKRKLD
jgi:hypothetical protein